VGPVELSLVISWFVFAAVIGYAAGARGHTAISWFLFAVLFSPLLAGLALALLPNKRQEKRMEAAARQPASVVGVADELAKLASLRDGGVITEEEFQRQRALLLPTPAPKPAGPTGDGWR
jgi:hypothetical protein